MAAISTSHPTGTFSSWCDIVRAVGAGIATVATAGILLGNVDIPYEDEIAAFEGDFTVVVLSFVFISLATVLSFEDLVSLGLGGLFVVVAVVALIRPVAVLL